MLVIDTQAFGELAEADLIAAGARAAGCLWPGFAVTGHSRPGAVLV